MPKPRRRTNNDSAGFQVLTAVAMKNTIFWDLTPYISL
jgi:hypothetical protein